MARQGRARQGTEPKAKVSTTMKSITYELLIEGTTPLLMHSAQLVNPFNRLTKQLAAAVKAHKKNGTDEAMLETAKCEFLGGLYIDEHGPYIPAENLRQSLRDAARRTKKGRVVERGGLEVLGIDGDLDRLRLIYDGPKTAAGLWGDGDIGSNPFVDYRSAKVGQSRVMRTRPRFPQWSIRLRVIVDTETIDPEEAISFCTRAGEGSGIGDARSLRFGRFRVASADEV